LLVSAEQPTDQAGALAEARFSIALAGLVREFCFDLLQHSRQRRGKREEGLMGQLQLMGTATTDDLGRY